MLNKNYKNLLQSHEYIENECFELEIKNKVFLNSTVSKLY